MTSNASYINWLFLGNSIITIHDKVLPIFDPTQWVSYESLVLDTDKQRNVLVFYPTDFSFVCPTELAKLNELYNTFLAENSEVFVISRDSILVHEKWIQTDPSLQWFKIKMVSDKEWILWRDIWLINTKTSEYERVSMIITPKWEIGYIEVAPSKVWRNIEELLRKIQALNYIIKHPEMLCQENRKSGDQWIHPSH